MELNRQTLRRVWWKGAITAALKGIPQGIILGIIGAGILFGLCVAIGPALAGPMGAFIFTSSGSINLLPMIALNTVLTAVGNFLTGGKIACNAFKQDVQHRMNEVRIDQIEARELALEQTVTRPSRAVQTIIAKGPRAQQSFAAAEESRAAQTGPRIVH